MIQPETDAAQKEFDVDVADNTYRQSKNTLLALLALPKFIDFTPGPIGEMERIEVPLGVAYDLAEKTGSRLSRPRLTGLWRRSRWSSPRTARSGS